MNDRIEVDPMVMLGKPCIRGTRITVEHLLRCLGAGETVDQLLQDYPGLSAEDIAAAIEFGADSVHAAWRSARDWEWRIAERHGR